MSADGVQAAGALALPPLGEPSIPPRTPVLTPQRVRLTVSVLKRATELAPHLAAWTTLAREACEPNPFYEPWALLPALEAASRAELALVLIHGPSNGVPGPLWGFFPLERRGAAAGLPLPHLRLWLAEHTFVPVPLIHRAHGAEVMEAFFGWLGSQRRSAALLAIDELPVGGPFHQLLVDHLARSTASVYARDRFTRALLAPHVRDAGSDSSSLSSKHRKNFARRRRRLAELGRLEVDTLRADSDVDAWIGEFLTLEASGWKGRSGTALDNDPRHVRFFTQMARRGHREGRFLASALRLDGRPIAMQTMLRARSLGYAFKIAYDERYARYSPGVLLVLDLMERVTAGWEVRSVDSVADRNHPMVNELWSERRCIESLLIAESKAMSLALWLAPAMRWLSSTLRSRAREA